MAIYLLHTTISELLSKRTLGKWLFSLRVASVYGTEPTRGQLLMRNLLRVIDLLCLPVLFLVLLSPLAQRSADVAAGTLVTRDDDQSASELEDKQSDNSDSQ